jgi:hypothetical protein
MSKMGILPMRHALEASANGGYGQPVMAGARPSANSSSQKPARQQTGSATHVQRWLELRWGFR